MTKRTTFAFDTLTIKRIKRLAEHWNVSQAEAVRRAVEITEKKEISHYGQVKQPVSLMQWGENVVFGLMR